VPIHPTAVVSPKAEIDPSVEVGPYSVIDSHVRIAAGCRLMHHVYVTGWTSIGEGCTLHPGVVVGHEPQDIKYKGERTFCRVGARNIFREYVTVHRGTTPESETVIGDDCFLLAGSHIGHNCLVGSRVTMVNNALLAGHVEVADQVTLGGAAAVHQFVRVGRLSMIGGHARVPMDVLPFAMVDEGGRIAGVNTIGMRRAGIAREDILEVRAAYRTILSSPGGFREGVNRLLASTLSPVGSELTAFLQAPTKRGFAGKSRRRGRSAGAADGGE
jgi:UDP-N-acetylglucosamine acyltransferase